MSRDKSINLAALVLRLALGIMFVAHGLLKVFVFTLPGTVQFFAQVGFPGYLAYVVVTMEIAGGTLLLLGIATRPVALALLPILLGALSVHFGFGWLFTNANGGWEYPAFLAVATVVQALLGDGAMALHLPVRQWARAPADPVSPAAPTAARRPA